MTTKGNLFHDMLREEFQKRSQQVDVVDEKRKKFQEMISNARDTFRAKKYGQAKRLYFDIIDYLKTEPYLDELDLQVDTEFYVKCCFCYSSILDKKFSKDPSMDAFTRDLLKELVNDHNTRLLPKYLQVRYYYKRKNWPMTFYLCIYIKELAEDDAETRCQNSFDLFHELLPTPPMMAMEIAMYEGQAYYGCGMTLAKKNLHHPSMQKYLLWFKESENLVMSKVSKDKSMTDMDLHQLYHETVLPLWSEVTEDGMQQLYYDERFLTKCKQCMRAKFRQDISKEHPDITEHEAHFELVVNSFIRYYSKDSNDAERGRGAMCQGCISQSEPNKKNKNVASGEWNNGTAQVQTDKLKTENKMVQTNVKTRNAEVQVNFDGQLLNTVLDIKSNLLATQDRKDEMIAKLNRKVCELNDRLNKEVIKQKAAEEAFQQKHTKNQFEIAKLKDQLAACKKQRKLEADKNVFLQKFVVDQINDEFNLRKHIYKIIEKKASFMVTYLKELSTSLTPTSIPDQAICKRNIDMWEIRLKKIVEDLQNLKEFYNRLKEDVIHSEKFYIGWPELPDCPKDHENIVFTSFKPAIHNMIGIENRLLNKQNGLFPGPTPPPRPIYNGQYMQPSQFPPLPNSYYVGPTLAYPNSPSPGGHPHSVPLPHSPPRVLSLPYEEPNRNLKTRGGTDTSASNRPSDQRGTASTSASESHDEAIASTSRNIPSDKQDQEDEKMLFEYVLDNCPGATEEQITLALLQIVDDHKGTLSNVPKDQIVEDVKVVLRTKKLSAWVTPKSPHLQWDNECSYDNCTICFEDLSEHTTYTLPCQHRYHKECIKKWLKTSSVCPICRVHSVIDEEFPPLH